MEISENSDTNSKKYSAIEKFSQWQEIHGGFLKIGHKPGGKNLSFHSLRDEGTTAILTLLSAREGASAVRDSCRNLQMDWLWLPLADGKIPPKKLNPEILSVFEILKSKLENRERIFIHCSAGLHRTGMITHALLLFLGFDEPTALDLLRKLRPITADEVREHRLQWGVEFVGALKSF